MPTIETRVRAHDRRRPHQSKRINVRAYNRWENQAKRNEQHQISFDEMLQQRIVPREVRVKQPKIELVNAPCGPTECLRANSKYCAKCSELTGKIQDSYHYIDSSDPNAELTIERERQEGLFNAN